MAGLTRTTRRNSKRPPTSYFSRLMQRRGPFFPQTARVGSTRLSSPAHSPAGLLDKQGRWGPALPALGFKRDPAGDEHRDRLVERLLRERLVQVRFERPHPIFHREEMIGVP